MIEVKFNYASVPDGLLRDLERKQLQYTNARELYHLIWLSGSEWCGVFGDGPNGSYEWFWKTPKGLETSNVGYGSIEIALMHVLVRATVVTSHDAEDVGKSRDLFYRPALKQAIVLKLVTEALEDENS